MKFFTFYCILFFLSLQAQDTLSKSDIPPAEKMFGLRFNDAKRDSMLSDVQSQLESYQRLRAIELQNSVVPSVLFNPIPVGMTPPKGKSVFAFDAPKNIDVPKNPDDLAFYSVAELGSLIKSKKITSTQLTKLYLERLRKYGPMLQCVITLTDSLALAHAARADKEIAAGKYRGPLHGIPYGAKDLLAAKKYPTTWGSVPFKDQVIDEDATVIKKLEAAGAILVAKLTMGELAWGDVWFGGMTRSPWDTSHGSSGSSAGSASATAAGLVAFAIGSETYGSIVSPSTRCGTTGLRPTYGRVSRAGAMALSWTMDKLGPICRSAEDCAIVFNAIYGPDGIDQTVYDVPFRYEPKKTDLKKLRIGYLKTDFDSAKFWKSYNDSVLIVLQKLGATLIPIELPNYPVGDISIMLSAESAAAFDDVTRSGKDDMMVRQIKNAWPNSFRASRFIPAVEYIQASRVRTLLIQEMAKLMKTIDVYINPSLEGNSLLLTNLTGHPCVTVPNGFTEKGTPVSITFTGKLFDEGTVLAVAKKYQDATGYHLKHPKLD
ncbi:MAG: amidase [Ignavibacteriales bacterium]|nr:amidase [Ignavibacteriales bacterium]